MKCNHFLHRVVTSAAIQRVLVSNQVIILSGRRSSLCLQPYRHTPSFTAVLGHSVMHVKIRIENVVSTYGLFLLVPRSLLGGVLQPPAADLLAKEDPLSGQDL